MAKALPEITLAPGATLDDAQLTSTEPYVIRGLAAAWPLVQAARASAAEAAAYLQRFGGGAPVTAWLGGPEIGGRFFYNEDMSGFNYEARRARLDQVLGELLACADKEQPPAIYVGSTMIDASLPGLRAENDLDFGAREPLASIWIGNRTRVCAHYDLPDNIACVAAGRRRFTLFPPGQIGNMYMGPLDFNPAGQAVSMVDLAQPDLQRYPRFADALAEARVAELEAGDAIFIPSMWLHDVAALEPFNILVNYWWRQSPPWMDTPQNTLMHALLSMRDLPPAQRQIWKQLFGHYVFDSDGSEAAHLPPSARGILAPLDADAARSLRAFLLNRLNR
ncbi:cupin-like domain-containing protein [Massilia endophytica]|uniref:cupin-like domain-containing protein n=1 Tax=Massilia endophytica TaxID=2899220 RepID=UPI001E2E8F07|nr:cupin-like domain-containing protein [Massilia endophytica]UGQ46519.1 cupin-like domain-containing protein [Massilia endophytica]